VFLSTARRRPRNRIPGSRRPARPLRTKRSLTKRRLLAGCSSAQQTRRRVGAYLPVWCRYTVRILRLQLFETVTMSSEKERSVILATDTDNSTIIQS
jgi:hypothetical protein